MAKSSQKLLRIKARFESVLKEQENFVESLPSIHAKSKNRTISINKKKREQLCEMSFSIIFTAWEQLLEEAFKIHIEEATALSFKKRNLVLVARPETIHELVCGGRKYVEWANSNVVREKAKIFFKNGEPFESSLSAISNDLNNMRIIRNRCVHFSKHADEKYKKLIRHIYGTGRKFSPGEFLSQTPPPGLSTIQGVENYKTVFHFFSGVLLAATTKLIP